MSTTSSKIKYGFGWLLLIGANLAQARPGLAIETEGSTSYQRGRISVNLNDLPANKQNKIKIKNYRSWYTYLPFYEDNSAEIIVFAPKSNHSLYLSGEYLLVGHPASLIFYQPAGIICDDCSFANVNKVIFASRPLVELSEILAALPDDSFKFKAQIKLHNLIVDDYTEIMGDELIVSGKFSSKNAKITSKQVQISNATINSEQLDLQTQHYCGKNNYFFGREAQIVAKSLDDYNSIFRCNNLIFRLFNGELGNCTINSTNFTAESQGIFKLCGGAVDAKSVTLSGEKLIAQNSSPTKKMASVVEPWLNADYVNLNHRKQDLISLNVTADTVNVNSEAFKLGKYGNFCAHELYVNSKQGEVAGSILGVDKALLRGEVWRIDGKLFLAPQNIKRNLIYSIDKSAVEVLIPQLSIESRQLFGNGCFEIITPECSLVTKDGLIPLISHLNIDGLLGNFTGKLILKGNNSLKLAHNSASVIDDLTLSGDLTILGGELTFNRIAAQKANLHFIGDKILLNSSIDNLSLLTVRAAKLLVNDVKADTIDADIFGDCSIKKLFVGKQALFNADNLDIFELVSDPQAKVWLNVQKNLLLNVTTAPQDLILRARNLKFNAASVLKNFEIADSIIPLNATRSETVGELSHKIKRIVERSATQRKVTESSGVNDRTIEIMSAVNAGLVVNELLYPLYDGLRPATLIFAIDQPINIDGEFAFYGAEFRNTHGLTIDKPATIVVSGNLINEEFFIGDTLIIFVGDEFKNLNQLQVRGDLLFSGNRALNYGSIDAINLAGWLKGESNAFSGLKNSTLTAVSGLRITLPNGSAYFGYMSSQGAAKACSISGDRVSPHPEGGTNFIASSVNCSNGSVILEAAKNLIMDGTDIYGNSIFLFAGGELQQNVVQAKEHHIDHYDGVYYLERVCGRCFRVCISHHMEERFRWEPRYEYSTKVPSIVALKGEGVITGHHIDFGGMIAALKKIIVIGSEVNLRTTIIEKNTHAALGIGDKVVDVGLMGNRLISAKTPEESEIALQNFVKEQNMLTTGDNVPIKQVIEIIPTRMISGKSIEIESDKDINFAVPLLFSKGEIKVLSKHGNIEGKAYFGTFLDRDDGDHNYHSIVAHPGAIYANDQLQIVAPDGKINFAGVYLETGEMALLAKDSVELTGSHATVIQHTHDKRRSLFGSCDRDIWWGHSVLIPTHITSRNMTVESTNGDLTLKGVQGQVVDGGIRAKVQGKIKLTPYEIEQHYRDEVSDHGFIPPDTPEMVFKIEDRLVNTIEMLRFLRPEIAELDRDDYLTLGESKLREFYDHYHSGRWRKVVEIPTIVRSSNADIKFNAGETIIEGSALIAEDSSVWINAEQFALKPKVVMSAIQLREHQSIIDSVLYNLVYKDKYEELTKSNFIPGSVLASEAYINAEEIDIGSFLLANKIWINATNLELSGVLSENKQDNLGCGRQNFFCKAYLKRSHIVPALIYGDKLYVSVDGTTRLVNSGMIGNQVELSTERLEVNNKGKKDLSATISEYSKIHFKDENPTLKAFLIEQLNKLKCDNDAYLDLTSKLLQRDYVMLPVLQNKQIFENWQAAQVLIKQVLAEENLNLMDQRYYESFLAMFNLGNADDFINHEIDPLSIYQMILDLVDHQLLEEDLVALDRYHFGEMYDLHEVIKVLLGNTPVINDENEILFLKRSFGDQKIEIKIQDKLKNIVVSSSNKLIKSRKVKRKGLLAYYQQLVAVNNRLSPHHAGWSELTLDDEQILKLANSNQNDAADDQRAILRILLLLNRFIQRNFKDNIVSINELADYLNDYFIHEAKHQKSIALTANLQLVLHFSSQGKVLAKIKVIKKQHNDE